MTEIVSKHAEEIYNFLRDDALDTSKDWAEVSMFQSLLAQRIKGLDSEATREIAKWCIENNVLEIEDEEAKTDSRILDMKPEEFVKAAGFRPTPTFPSQEIEGDVKHKAQAYADWLIEEANIRPVVIDGKTLFYEYDELTRRWEEKEFEKILKMAHKDIGSDYTSHFRREFRHSYKDHHQYFDFEEMGLEEQEILMRNGEILNLNTRETRPASKEDKALNSVNAVYDPDAKPDRIKEFIERTIDREEGVKTLQEFLGYTLMWPSTKYEKALLILGYTDTGKSTLLNVFEHFYDNTNTTNVSFPQLGMERAFHIDKLKDSVVNFDHDMSDKEIKRKSRIKEAITGNRIHADPKGEQGYKFQPKAKFMIASNNAPDDKGAEAAFYNRFTTLTATNRIDPENKDRELLDKLVTEENMNWLLSWAIEGLERLQEQNQFSNERTEYETKKLWDKFGDSVQKFIHEQITLDREEGINVPTSDLYDVYEMWCEQKLETPKHKQQFISEAAAHPDIVKDKAMAHSGGRRMCFKHIEVQDFAV